MTMETQCTHGDELGMITAACSMLPTLESPAKHTYVVTWNDVRDASANDDEIQELHAQPASPATILQNPTVHSPQCRQRNLNTHFKPWLLSTSTIGAITTLS